LLRFFTILAIISGFCEAIARTTLLEAFLHDDDRVGGGRVGLKTKPNEYRLIVGLNYEEQTIFYKYFLTHAEYDKEKWKNDPYF